MSLIVTKRKISNVSLKVGCLPLLLLESSRPIRANAWIPGVSYLCVMLGPRTLNDDDDDDDDVLMVEPLLGTTLPYVIRRL